MNKLEVNKFLEDISFNSSIRFLEEGKDKDKLMEIAKKKDIVLPAHDLAVFECVYAFTDRQNKNGCTLPKEEVQASLPTLIGKSIDLDHFRKSVVGHWVDAKLDGDKIIAYGMIFKGSFEQDYEVIKDLFDKGNLAVSFEAWGDREFNDKGGYNLRDIEFAGGALLLKSEPAFDGAGVLELAKKNRVLEFAKVMTAPESFIHEREDARYYVYDMNNILRNLAEVECPSCKEKGYTDPLSIDFENNKTKTKCLHCDAEMAVSLTPAATLSKKGRKIKKMEEWVAKASIDKFEDLMKDFDGSSERLESMLEEAVNPRPKLSLMERAELTDEDFAVTKTIEVEKSKNYKVRIFPIHNLAHINFVKSHLNTDLVEKLLEKLNIAKDVVNKKISRRIITIAMKKLMEKYQKASAQDVIKEIAKGMLGRDLTKEELEKADYNIVTYKKSKGPASDNSLNKVPVTPANDNSARSSDAPSNETSLQTAELSEEELKAIITEITKATVESNLTELKAKDAEIAKVQAELVKITAELAEFRKAKDEAEKATVAEKIKSRREELADFAKDMKDEDVLDEAKYEIAKLKKENADLKAGKVITPAPVKKAEVDLSKGSNDKSQADAEKAARAKINELAFGKDAEKDETEE